MGVWCPRWSGDNVKLDTIGCASSSCGGSAADASSAGASAPGDVDMGEVEPVKLLNAPALLLPLSFKGSTKAERRAFMRKYQRYTSQIQALQSTSQQPFLMPVGACMEHFYKHRIAMFELGKSMAITCGIGRAQEPPTGAVEFDAKILDADSRVSRMLDNLMRVLEADGEEWVLHQEGKLVLEIITKAMKPAPLQVAVSKQQQLQRNMVLKMDVLRYVKRDGGTLTSGNETLVLEGLLLALERLGAKLNVETKPALALKPYGATSRPLQVTRQVQFKILTLETSIGPLVLRGLRAWVEVKKFEVDCSSDVHHGTTGISVDGLLEDALKLRRV
ncbi:hypothetical protein AaE_015957 [Aphanomyces astaci]|uniref:Uncharacterized protein n=1 Tax=Aphanomyces astaci TaxID=112090 RepID=A0A6A4Z081_APHAT|nr:hypothetical protein AaE_015957 [Aphanomyces astaci]